MSGQLLEDLVRMIRTNETGRLILTRGGATDEEVQEVIDATDDLCRIMGVTCRIEFGPPPAEAVDL